MILVPIIALLLGAILALGLKVRVGDSMAQYLAVACLAGLDTVLGGMRSAYESKFQTDVFLSGFFANVLIAFFIAWLGDQIGINLYMVVALVMGMRIFTNLSLLRRYLLVRATDWIAKRKKEREKQLEQTMEGVTE
ncbi:MAG: small basic family protein [Fimbriimonas sp.]|nr:small basic family protein [Fimbriimonas sp.]